MRTRLSPAAKLAAALGVLLSMATTIDYGSVWETEESEPFILENGGLLYFAGTATANAALQEIGADEVRLDITIVGDNLGTEPVTLRLWRLDAPLEGATLPPDARESGQGTIAGDATDGWAQHAEMYRSLEVEFFYVLAAEGGALEGGLSLEAGVRLVDEKTGEEAIDLEITDFEVLP